LLLLGPGLSTPHAKTNLGQVEYVGSSSEGNADALKAYLSGLSKPEQQAVSNSLATYRRSPAPEIRNFPVRRRLGPANAPVKFVEFTDIRCSHCAQLLEVMKQIEKVVPSDRISIEARNFPLDAACNPALKGSDGTGMRCLGAKAQICLENAPDFWELREKLFSEQETLTPQRIVEIASSGSIKRADLDACLGSPETNQKLSEDIAYAMLFSPQGTPLVLINGREALAIPSFLLAMALTGANPDSPAFAALPPSHAAGQP
jgi:serine/threonine-protein kinase